MIAAFDGNVFYRQDIPYRGGAFVAGFKHHWGTGEFFGHPTLIFSNRTPWRTLAIATRVPARRRDDARRWQ